MSFLSQKIEVGKKHIQKLSISSLLPWQDYSLDNSNFVYCIVVKIKRDNGENTLIRVVKQVQISFTVRELVAT